MAEKYFRNIEANKSISKDGANIKKSLVSFNVLRTHKRGRIVPFSKGNKIYIVNEKGTKTEVETIPDKVYLEKTVYKL